MTIKPSISETITRVYAFDVTAEQVKTALTSIALQNLPDVDPQRASCLVELTPSGARITLTEAIAPSTAPALSALPPPATDATSQPAATPGSAKPEPSFIPWTETEVETVISLARSMPGATKTAIAKAAEGRLPGRGWRAILQQLQRKLADRVEAAMREAQAPRSVGKARPRIAQPELASPQKPAPASTACELRPVWWRPIEILIDSLSNKGGWSREDDLALVEARMRGDDWMLIADALGRERGAIRQRWITLTPDGDKGLHLDHLAQVLRHRIEASK